MNAPNRAENAAIAEATAFVSPTGHFLDFPGDATINAPVAGNAHRAAYGLRGIIQLLTRNEAARIEIESSGVARELLHPMSVEQLHAAAVVLADLLVDTFDTAFVADPD